MPSSKNGKYRARITYILIVVVGCVVAAGAMAYYQQGQSRPGQSSPHALDQSQ